MRTNGWDDESFANDALFYTDERRPELDRADPHVRASSSVLRCRRTDRPCLRATVIPTRLRASSIPKSSGIYKAAYRADDVHQDLERRGQLFELDQRRALRLPRRRVIPISKSTSRSASPQNADFTLTTPAPFSPLLAAERDVRGPLGCAAGRLQRRLVGAHRARAAGVRAVRRPMQRALPAARSLPAERVRRPAAARYVGGSGGAAAVAAVRRQRRRAGSRGRGQRRRSGHAAAARHREAEAPVAAVPRRAGATTADAGAARVRIRRPRRGRCWSRCHGLCALAPPESERRADENRNTSSSWRSAVSRRNACSDDDEGMDDPCMNACNKLSVCGMGVQLRRRDESTVSQCTSFCQAAAGLQPRELHHSGPTLRRDRQASTCAAGMPCS